MKNLIAIVTALLLSTNLFSCADNDNSLQIESSAEKIVGNYNGTMQASAMGQNLSFDNVEVAVTPASDNAVNISIASFGNPPMVLPAIIIKNVEVTGIGSTYSLASTEFSGTCADGKIYNGTVIGNADSKLNLQIELHYGAMPMPLICTYSGSHL